MKTKIIIFFLSVCAMITIGSSAFSQTDYKHHDNDNDNVHHDCVGKVDGFTLVHSGQAGDIDDLKNGDDITMDCSVNIRADIDCDKQVESVEFRLNGTRFTVENIAPYALGGDNNGSYNPLSLAPGNYTLKAIPWTGNNATGTQGTSRTVSFTVTSDACNSDNDNVSSCCDLKSEMRALWEDHVIWTRNVIFNFIDSLPGTNEAVARLLQNQVDIGNIFKPYFGVTNGNKLTAYLHNHITIAAEILTAVVSNDTAAFNDANTRWYLNADSIVAFLHSINPQHWSIADGTDMFYEHLEYTTTEVVARATANYALDVANFDTVQMAVLEMADFFTDGIIAKFPDRFSCGNDDNDADKRSIHEQSVKLSDKSIVLNQNSPNPFADQTMIQYFIPETVKEAKILFYDGKGSLINTLNIEEKGEGKLTVFTPDLSQGIYTYSIVADGKVIDTKKMVHQN